MKFLFLLILLLIFLIGLSEILHSVKLHLYAPKKNNNKIMLCVLNDDTAELDLQYIIEQHRWQGRAYADKVMCINQIESATILKACEELAFKNNIRFASKDELISIIESES